MNNGDGLRVVLWLSGCSHECKNCQNPQTWNPKSGIEFNNEAKEELFAELSKDYISGITLSGGDPLYSENLIDVLDLVNEIRLSMPEKTIWLYSGFTWLEALNNDLRHKIIDQCDVMVDGRFVDELKDLSAKWKGSTNQRVIDVQESLKQNKVVLYCD
jgi:anaerobic ribonucleoside-triphosphate reductase activating protein